MSKRASRRIRNDNRKLAPGLAAAAAAAPDLDIFVRRSPMLALPAAQAVTEQLGYLPMNLIEIGAFAVDNPDMPLVAVLYPLLSNNLGGRYDRTNAQGMPGWRTKRGKDIVNDEEVCLTSAETDAIEHDVNKQNIDHSGDDLQSEEYSNSNDHLYGKPFPTMLWMTCPTLHARVCKLEDQGWILRLDQRLKEHPEHLARMEAAHRAYGAARWSLLTDDDKAFLARKGWEAPLRDTGIAGIHDFHTVKCLHGHYAHFLSRPQDDNLIGEWVHELLQS